MTVVLGVWCAAGCAATPTAVLAPPSGVGGTGLVVTDPAHKVVQPFPLPGSCHARGVPGGVLPDPTCTPGAIDPHVTAATVDTTVCRRGGYTSTVRPPVEVTDAEKRLAIAAYSYSGPAASTELDHLVPLALGGSPNSPANLWPEPGASPNAKDALEDALRERLCTHRIGLDDAQRMIATNWITAYQQILGHLPPG